VRLIQEATENGNSIPMLTYDYKDVTLGPPADSLFEITQGYNHHSCERFVGGFPYLHIFHYFVRF